jgi:hypothetical protein
MNVDQPKAFLLWTTAINYGVLFIWFGVFVYAHDWLYRTHTHWFKLSAERFDVLHYVGMSIYKVGILLFNVAPLVALCIVS